MIKNEIRIQYEKETENISFFPAKELPPSTQVMMIGNVLAILIHQQCKFYKNTKKERTQILKAILKDMEDQLAFMDEEEE